METNKYGFNVDLWPMDYWNMKEDDRIGVVMKDLTKQNFNYHKDDFAMSKTNNSQFMDKKAGDLQPGDHFWYADSEHRVVDHNDYEKIFGHKFPYYDSKMYIMVYKICSYSNIISYFHYLVHFSKSAIVSVKRTPITLYSLEVGQDFEYKSNRYILMSKGLISGDYCYCIGLGDQFKGNRQQHLSGNFEVFPI